MARVEPTPSRLLAAARAAFARAGFEGASTHGIAEAAGVHQGLVRHHFGSKEGLWDAVVEQGLSELGRELGALGDGLTVAAWAAIVERHVLLVGVLLHALLHGERRAEAAVERAAPVWRALRTLQRRAQPLADETLLPMWLFASVAMPLLRTASRDGVPWMTRSQEIDRLFAWLCAESAAAGHGPFALHAGRMRLRGTR